ncbi:MAG TPA: hypothetical protein VI997_06195, partial [Candidatus Thermoplasmatota archaeon]|nr:hypothetical protein [Candidatus Thermoplasmatota archaeon]
GGRLARNLAWLAVATPLLGLALNVFFGGGIAVDAAGTAGIARLAMAAILAYAILRHQLFDLDVKVKWTLRRGTLAAMFLAVFFVVAQVAQTFLTDALGLVVGGMAAGLLLFAIAPLQRMAERVADVAMPGVRDPRERAVALGADEAYREALRMALEDGVITPAEERSLARMARQLGIDPERALDLRDEVRGVLGA